MKELMKQAWQEASAELSEEMKLSPQYNMDAIRAHIKFMMAVSKTKIEC